MDKVDIPSVSSTLREAFTSQQFGELQIKDYHDFTRSETYGHGCRQLLNWIDWYAYQQGFYIVPWNKTDELSGEISNKTSLKESLNAVREVRDDLLVDYQSTIFNERTAVTTLDTSYIHKVGRFVLSYKSLSS